MNEYAAAGIGAVANNLVIHNTGVCLRYKNAAAILIAGIAVGNAKAINGGRNKTANVDDPPPIQSVQEGGIGVGIRRFGEILVITALNSELLI